MSTEPVDIGHGVSYEFFVDSTGVKVGAFIHHEDCPRIKELYPSDTTFTCKGHIMFDIPANAERSGAKWTLESLDPLTVSPSILRRECGLHGFIREGEWIPA